MAYLGKVPSIDSQWISDSVSSGFDRALEALVLDPETGQMVFDEEKIDQFLEEKSQYLKDEPLILPLPLSPGSESGQPSPVLPIPAQSGAAEFLTSTGNGGGGMFPLMAVGLLAYLSSR